MPASITDPVDTVHEARVLLIGPSGVGKSTWINRIKTGEFTRTHVPTAVNTSSLSFLTSHGRINVEVTEKRTHDDIAYDMVFVMFDLTSMRSFQQIEPYVNCGNCIILGNKVDSRGRVVTPLFLRSKIINMDNYIEMSAKTNYHFELAFLKMARAMFNDNRLIFVAEQAVDPPEVMI